MYFFYMEEDVDDKQKKDMKSWDCAIAVLMIGIVPITIYFVFYNRNLWSLIIPVSLLLFCALAVFAVVALTGWVVVGRIIHALGCVLTPIFFYMTYLIWEANDAFNLPQMWEERELDIPWPWEDRGEAEIIDDQN